MFSLSIWLKTPVFSPNSPKRNNMVFEEQNPNKSLGSAHFKNASFS